MADIYNPDFRQTRRHRVDGVVLEFPTIEGAVPLIETPRPAPRPIRRRRRPLAPFTFGLLSGLGAALAAWWIF